MLNASHHQINMELPPAAAAAVASRKRHLQPSMAPPHMSRVSSGSADDDECQEQLQQQQRGGGQLKHFCVQPIAGGGSGTAASARVYPESPSDGHTKSNKSMSSSIFQFSHTSSGNDTTAAGAVHNNTDPTSTAAAIASTIGTNTTSTSLHHSSPTSALLPMASAGYQIRRSQSLAFGPTVSSPSAGPSSFSSDSYKSPHRIGLSSRGHTWCGGERFPMMNLMAHSGDVHQAKRQPPPQAAIPHCSLDQRHHDMNMGVLSERHINLPQRSTSCNALFDRSSVSTTAADAKRKRDDIVSSPPAMMAMAMEETPRLTKAMRQEDDTHPSLWPFAPPPYLSSQDDTPRSTSTVSTVGVHSQASSSINVHGGALPESSGLETRMNQLGVSTIVPLVGLGSSSAGKNDNTTPPTSSGASSAITAVAQPAALDKLSGQAVVAANTSAFCLPPPIPNHHHLASSSSSSLVAVPQITCMPVFTPTRDELYRLQLDHLNHDSLHRIVKACCDANVKIVVLDLDRTLLSVHTKGKWNTSAYDLSLEIRPQFRALIPLILRAKLILGIATFSPQEALVEKILTVAFEGDVRLNENTFVRGSRQPGSSSVPTFDGSNKPKLFRRGSYSEFCDIDEGAEASSSSSGTAAAAAAANVPSSLPSKAKSMGFIPPPPVISAEVAFMDDHGKRDHIACITQRSGLTVLPSQILFIDDDANNVDWGRRDGHRVVHFNPLDPDELVPECLSVLL